MSSVLLLEPMKVEHPVMNTFIQYPALRTDSLEEFLDERETKSCPASRMVSLEEEPQDFSIPTLAPATQVAQLKQHVLLAPRDCTMDSLEEFFMDRESKPSSAPQVAPMMPVFQTPRDCTVDSLEEFFIDRETKPAATAFDVGLVEHKACHFPTFFQYPVFTHSREVSTAASTATSEHTDLVTPDLSDNESETQSAQKLTISLTDGLGIESEGSAAHMAGNCKPCAFLWKPEGCKQGQNCTFCHLCPIGEVKRRKKEKLALRKMARGFQSGFQNTFQNQVLYSMF